MPVTVRLFLVQGTRAETLGVTRVRSGVIAGYDPRIFKESRTVVVNDSTLSRFEAGPAQLRAVAIGSMQWLRVPPPTIRESAVQIVR